MIEQLKADPQVMALQKLGVSFKYNYVDKSDNVIATITIAPEDIK